MPKYDWATIRDRYILGDVTLDDLANQPDAPHPSTIRMRAAKESWAHKRQQHRDKIATRTHDIEATDAAEIASRHMRIGKALQQIGLTALRRLRPEEIGPRDAIELVKVGQRIEADAQNADPARDDPGHELEAIATALANPVEPSTLN